MKCDECNKKSTIHYQICLVKWNIVDDKIDLTSQEFIDGFESVYLCEVHDVQ